MDTDGVTVRRDIYSVAFRKAYKGIGSKPSEYLDDSHESVLSTLRAESLERLLALSHHITWQTIP